MTRIQHIKKTRSQMENEIEGGLVTMHEYSDPRVFMPRNQIARFLKQVALFCMRVYTTSQVIFNKNVFYTINRLFIQNLLLQDRVSRLETEIKILKRSRASKK